MPPPGRQSEPVSSGRYLVLRHRRQRLDAIRENRLGKSSPVKPDEKCLDSSYTPELREITNDAVVKETVTLNPPGQKIPEKSTESFKVLAPRFALDPDCIYSTFPAAGHSAPVTCLPHVVLHDALLPWDRVADGSDAAALHDKDLPDRVPWLICVTFEPKELQLTNEEMQSMFPHSLNSDSNKSTQSPTMAVDLDVSDLVNLDPNQIVTPVKQVEDVVETKTSVIAIPAGIFNNLFTKYDAEGNPQSQSSCDVSHYRLLAHMRNVPTNGIAYAGIQDEVSDQNFGVVLSHRTGPPSCKTPTTLVSHLLSIEGVSTMSFPVDESKRVVLPSLFSWTHTCQPSEMMNLPNLMSHLAEGGAMLRPPLSEVNPTPDSIEALKIHKYLKDGYSLVRYRTITGEATSALNRGPLVPSAVEFRLRNAQSNLGQSLQILDQQLGLMDVSYSTAWNLGRDLAVADATFTKALLQVRNAILQNGTSERKRQAMRVTGVPKKTREDLLASLHDLTQETHMPTIIDPSREQRWKRPNTTIPVEVLDSKVVDSAYQDELDRAAYQIASGYEEGSLQAEETNGTMPAPYDELNVPTSPDWRVVLRFVLDLLFLIRVPSQYLFSEPKCLPEESLRFFYIDENWTHALVDGALSLGNHVDQKEDHVRKAIHKAIQRYRQKPHPELEDVPPTPKFGLLLRSDLVARFPDLEVKVESKTTERSPTCLLARHEVLSPGVMLVFLTEIPDFKYEVSFTPPAHQQCFSIADELNGDNITISYKKIYSMTENDSDLDSLQKYSWTRENQDYPLPFPAGPGAVYIWGSKPGLEDIRTLLVNNLAWNLYNSLGTKLSFEGPTAAMMGIQLNNSSWQFKIELPVSPSPFIDPIDTTLPDLWQPRV
ncbi:uncharacterized protein N7511_005394 [Penicillium nucicola]|uniref:uncharacterized protein n=1 Tax=Penicillium nucicola TaxID=1850975 RepID=UPI0025453F0D|nr:uncharacterized protein N7511_005394 [Penicillium nucicola]KAJ5762012.1 hypothetical protein N7511_005394 [Penicillium nucicola]